MSRTFTSFAAFAGHLATVISDMERAKREGLDAAATVLLDEARSIPGTYQAGWPRLKAETIARKSTGDSPLKETGALAESYQKIVGADVAHVGSNADTALWQELGTSRGIPPRPVLGAALTNKGAEAAKAAGAKIAAAIVKS